MDLVKTTLGRPGEITPEMLDLSKTTGFDDTYVNYREYVSNVVNILNNNFVELQLGNAADIYTITCLRGTGELFTRMLNINVDQSIPKIDFDLLKDILDTLVQDSIISQLVEYEGIELINDNIKDAILSCLINICVYSIQSQATYPHATPNLHLIKSENCKNQYERMRNIIANVSGNWAARRVFNVVNVIAIKSSVDIILNFKNIYTQQIKDVVEGEIQTITTRIEAEKAAALTHVIDDKDTIEAKYDERLLQEKENKKNEILDRERNTFMGATKAQISTDTSTEKNDCITSLNTSDDNFPLGNLINPGVGNNYLEVILQNLENKVKTEIGINLIDPQKKAGLQGSIRDITQQIIELKRILAQKTKERDSKSKTYNNKSWGILKTILTPIEKGQLGLEISFLNEIIEGFSLTIIKKERENDELKKELVIYDSRDNQQTKVNSRWDVENKNNKLYRIVLVDILKNISKDNEKASNIIEISDKITEMSDDMKTALNYLEVSILEFSSVSTFGDNKGVKGEKRLLSSENMLKANEFIGKIKSKSDKINVLITNLNDYPINALQTALNDGFVNFKRPFDECFKLFVEKSVLADEYKKAYNDYQDVSAKVDAPEGEKNGFLKILTSKKNKFNDIHLENLKASIETLPTPLEELMNVSYTTLKPTIIHVINYSKEDKTQFITRVEIEPITPTITDRYNALTNLITDDEKKDAQRLMYYYCSAFIKIFRSIIDIFLNEKLIKMIQIYNRESLNSWNLSQPKDKSWSFCESIFEKLQKDDVLRTFNTNTMSETNVYNEEFIKIILNGIENGEKTFDIGDKKINIEHLQGVYNIKFSGESHTFSREKAKEYLMKLLSLPYVGKFKWTESLNSIIAKGLGKNIFVISEYDYDIYPEPLLPLTYDNSMVLLKVEETYNYLSCLAKTDFEKKINEIHEIKKLEKSYLKMDIKYYLEANNNNVAQTIAALTSYYTKKKFDRSITTYPLNKYPPDFLSNALQLIIEEGILEEKYVYNKIREYFEFYFETKLFSQLVDDMDNKIWFLIKQHKKDNNCFDNFARLDNKPNLQNVKKHIWDILVDKDCNITKAEAQLKELNENRTQLIKKNSSLWKKNPDVSTEVDDIKELQKIGSKQLTRDLLILKELMKMGYEKNDIMKLIKENRDDISNEEKLTKDILSQLRFSYEGRKAYNATKPQPEDQALETIKKTLKGKERKSFSFFPGKSYVYDDKTIKEVLKENNNLVEESIVMLNNLEIVVKKIPRKDFNMKFIIDTLKSNNNDVEKTTNFLNSVILIKKRLEEKGKIIGTSDIAQELKDKGLNIAKTIVALYPQYAITRKISKRSPEEQTKEMERDLDIFITTFFAASKDIPSDVAFQEFKVKKRNTYNYVKKLAREYYNRGDSLNQQIAKEIKKKVKEKRATQKLKKVSSAGGKTRRQKKSKTTRSRKSKGRSTRKN